MHRVHTALDILLKVSFAIAGTGALLFIVTVVVAIIARLVCPDDPIAVVLYEPRGTERVGEERTLDVVALNALKFA